MATLSKTKRDRIEMYARVLLEAAKAEGHEKKNLDLLRALGDMPSELRETLKVIVEQGDSKYLNEIADEYEELINSGDSTVPVEVTTAIPLDDDLRGKITFELKRELKRSVYLVEHVDPSILGGIIFSLGGKRRDISVLTQLEQARSILKSNITGE